MKHKNLKLKKACFILGSSFILYTYLNTDHVYKPNYTITEDEEYFAKYSKGKVYIGRIDYIESLKGKVNTDDILVIDTRNTKNDPNMQIISSYEISNKDTRNEILEILLKYEELNPSPWDRTIESMRLEWFVHNLSHSFNYKKDHSDDVDLDNDDQEKYENVKVLNKLLHL